MSKSNSDARKLKEGVFRCERCEELWPLGLKINENGLWVCPECFDPKNRVTSALMFTQAAAYAASKKEPKPRELRVSRAFEGAPVITNWYASAWMNASGGSETSKTTKTPVRFDKTGGQASSVTLTFEGVNLDRYTLSEFDSTPDSNVAQLVGGLPSSYYSAIDFSSYSVAADGLSATIVATAVEGRGSGTFNLAVQGSDLFKGIFIVAGNTHLVAVIG